MKIIRWLAGRELTADETIRLLSQVQKPDNSDDCWIWTGSCSEQGGYPRFWLTIQSKKCKGLSAGKLCYEVVYHSPVPSGISPHRSCKRIECVNPNHLVAMKRQPRRGTGVYLKMGHDPAVVCVYGHLRSENGYYVKGKWRCGLCDSTRAKRKRTGLERIAPPKLPWSERALAYLGEENSA